MPVSNHDSSAKQEMSVRVSEPLRLLCVLAHPDDESLGVGGTLAKYASEGVETYLVTATRGERGRFGSGIEFPGFSEVGKLREAELLAAAKELGLRDRKSTRLNSSHLGISYAVFCLKKKKK